MQARQEPHNLNEVADAVIRGGLLRAVFQPILDLIFLDGFAPFPAASRLFLRLIRGCFFEAASRPLMVCKTEIYIELQANATFRMKL